MEIDIVQLFRALMDDLCVDICTRLYLTKRLKNEGVKVVTVLLPAFAKHLLLCIERGCYTQFGTSIQHRKGLPVIFRGYLKSLFILNTETNQWLLSPNPDPVSLAVIRQVCEYAYKLALPFDEAVLTKAAENFVANDASVLGCGEYDYRFIDSMRKNFECYYRRASRINVESLNGSTRPGSGTFSGSKNLKNWYERKFSNLTATRLTRQLISTERLSKRYQKVKLVEEPDVSEVLFVPKDSRGPRVIVREPYHRLQVQLAFNSKMAAALEKDTNCRVNFLDQSVNRKLAQISSVTREYATLDLKDASDRVSYAIVAHLFRFLPLRHLLSYRVNKAALPDGRVLRLKKLAGMGSGYTFPCMALVIHLAICTNVSRKLRLPYRDVMKDVYVYGDDIILPSDWYDLATSALAFAGLKVNDAKSFKLGPFRESCGGDYLHGNDVTPVRLRMSGADLEYQHGVVRAQSTDHAILLLERHARELVSKQLYSAAEYCYKVIESHVGPLPYVSTESPILGRVCKDINLLASILPRDEDGTHTKVDVLTVKSVDRSMPGMCPYRFLKSKLAKVGCDTTYETNTQSSEYGVISVPHKLKLVRRKVSSLALI